MRHPWRIALLVSFPCCVVGVRPAAAAVSIVGATDATDIKITIDQPRFHHEILLAADAAEAKDVTIATTGLNSALTAIDLRCIVDGKTCADQKLTLAPLTGRTITLDATVTAPGTYTAFLTIIGAGARLDRRLVITRTAGALPIQVLAAAKLESITGGAERARGQAMSRRMDTGNQRRFFWFGLWPSTSFFWQQGLWELWETPASSAFSKS